VRLLAAALCEALSAIHAKDIVHRDLKPSNILLAADGPRVIDFGIVRALEATALTRTGSVTGSVGYVSPEQIRNAGQVGPPSDVFALGAVLAYAAAGRELFGEGRDAVILMRIMNRDFDLSGVPEDIRWLLEPCLREEPEERPTPGEVMSAMVHTPRSLREGFRPGWYTAAGAGPEPAERWLPERDSGEQESRVEYVAPLTVTEAPPVPPSRRRLLRGLTAGALAGVGAGTAGWLWLRDRGGSDGSGQGTAGAKSSPSAHPTPTPRPAVVDWSSGSARLSEMGGPSVTPSPDGDTLYFGGVDGRLHAVAWSGTERWATDLGEPPLYGGVVGTAAATDEGVYCLSGNGLKLSALELDGGVRWEHSLDKGRYDSIPVSADYLVVVTTDGGRLHAYAHSGRLVWDKRVSGSLSQPVVVNDVVYVADDTTLHGFSAEDGKQLPTSAAASAPDWPPRFGGTVVVPPSALLGDLVVTTSGNGLKAVDPDDGATVWTVEGYGDPAQSEPTVYDGLVYALLGQRLYVVDRTGTPKRILTLDGVPVLPEYSPVVDARHVYLATSKGISAVNRPT